MSTYVAVEEWAREISKGLCPYDQCPYSWAVDLAGIEPAKITLDEVCQVLSSIGERLDNAPPPPNRMSISMAAKAMLSLPPGEIRLRSRKYQQADALLAVANEPVFAYRLEVIRRHFPEWGDLPCSSTKAGNVVWAVYERAILVGPATSYPLAIGVERMIEWARRGALVIQPPWKYWGCTAPPEHFCWILPDHLPEVWIWWNAIWYYSNPLAYEAHLELRQFYRLSPPEGVVLGEIVGPSL